MTFPKKCSVFVNVLLKSAQRLYKDPRKLKRLLRSVSDYAKKNKKYILRFRDDLLTLFALLNAWIRGDYTKVPTGLIIWSIVALLYFIMPFDLIPDFIGPEGYIDDAFVITFVIRSFKKEIDEFRRWQKRKKSGKKLRTPATIKSSGSRKNPK